MEVCKEGRSVCVRRGIGIGVLCNNVQSRQAVGVV